MADFSKVIHYIEETLCKEFGVPGCDIRIMKAHETLLRHTFGTSDYEGKIPVSGNELYFMYSCTKVMTCTAAMQLVERGVIGLDDKVSRWLPQYADAVILENGARTVPENEMTVRHLFTMTGGLDYDLKKEPVLRLLKETPDAGTVQIVNAFSETPLCFTPGDRFQYSLCHDVLAAVVEVISGVRFGEYVKQNIFEPLGMKNSTFLLPEEEVEGLAAQYRFNAELGVPVNCGKQIQTYKLGSEYESGGAGCISTAEDYIKFLEALRVGDVILKKDTIQFMATDRLNDAQKATYWDQDWSYGLGLRCPKENGKTTDFGWGGAAGAFLAVDIPNGLTLYYAQHMLSSPYSNRLTYESVLEEL